MCMTPRSASLHGRCRRRSPASSAPGRPAESSREENTALATITAAPMAACSAVTVKFVHGLPGLEEYRTFTLIGVDGLPVYLLQCEEEPAVVLPVAEAFAVVSDYE